MDGQSVVLRAEKGKLKLSVSDEQNKEQELVYDLNKARNDERQDSQRKRSPKPPQPAHSATDKVQAVLAVWTERCKPVDVCRQLNINWITFNHWQRRAMEGMLQALESRVNLTKGEALSPRLQTLLQSRQRPEPLDQTHQPASSGDKQDCQPAARFRQKRSR